MLIKFFFIVGVLFFFFFHKNQIKIHHINPFPFYKEGNDQFIIFNLFIFDWIDFFCKTTNKQKFLKTNKFILSGSIKGGLFNLVKRSYGANSNEAPDIEPDKPIENGTTKSTHRRNGLLW